MRYSKFELVMRQAKVHEDSVNYVANTPNGIKEFARKFMEMDILPEEHFFSIMLNSKLEVIGYIEVSHGDLSSSVASPREVFKAAILQNASAIAVLHNHPSGDCSPSTADIEATERLKKAGKLLGITVLDHVIIAGNESYSFAENGIM